MPNEAAVIEALRGLIARSAPTATGPFCPLRLPALRACLRDLSPDFLEAGDPYLMAWQVATVADALAVPAVAFCHSDVIGPATGRCGRPAGRLASLYLRALYSRFQLVLAPSQTVAARLVDAGIERVVVQPLGVDPDTFTPACSDDKCTANAPTVTVSNSIQERVRLGIKHLAAGDPNGGWDWYLNADGTVRWSDCGFFGYSYGATHAAVISVYVRLGLIVVGSGPWNESHPEATWIKTASATPGIRAYAIYGKQDGRYADYENETKELGWPGPYPFELPTLTQGVITATTPWYMGSHSLLVDDQGHTEFCAGSNSVCLYSFDHDGQ